MLMWIDVACEKLWETHFCETNVCSLPRCNEVPILLRKVHLHCARNVHYGAI